MLKNNDVLDALYRKSNPTFKVKRSRKWWFSSKAVLTIILEHKFYLVKVKTWNHDFMMKFNRRSGIPSVLYDHGRQSTLFSEVDRQFILNIIYQAYREHCVPISGEKHDR